MIREETEIEEIAPWLVLILTLVGGGLRVLLLAGKGLWLDETISVWLAGHSVGELLQWVVRIDPNPPLYDLLLHYWMRLFGSTPYEVRLLSVLFGAGAIPIIYLTGKRLSGALVGLAAAAILAVSPFHIRFAQEAGMYTCLTFNAAVAMYALVRLLTDSRSVRPFGSQFREYLRAWRTPAPVETGAESNFSYRDETRSRSGWRAWFTRHRWLPIRAIETDLTWVAFVLFSAATLLSHNTAVLFLFAANLFVLGLMLSQRIKRSGPFTFQAPSLGNWVMAQAGIFLLWSPWSLAFIQQAARVDREFWIPKPGWETLTQALGAFLNESTLGGAGQVPLIWVLYAVVIGFGLAHFRKQISRSLFLVALFAVPFLSELIVSIRRPIFLDRTLIWTTIPLFLALAAGIVQFRFRLLMIAALGIFAINNLFFASDYFRFWQKEKWSDPAGYVALYAQKDDLILFNSNLAQIGFDYYFQPYEKQYFLEVEKRGVPVDLIDSASYGPRMAESDIPGLLALVSGRKRVWLVSSRAGYADPGGLIPRTLAAQMRLSKGRDFYGGKVQLYEAPQ